MLVYFFIFASFFLFQILIWWFITKVSPSNNASVILSSRSGNTANATQNAASSLCDEIVTLWRLATLNPKLSPNQRQDFLAKFRDWHISTIEKVRKARSNTSSNSSGVKKGDIENFPGFKPSIEACALTWDDYPIQGVTYSSTDGSRFYYHFGSNKPHDSDSKKPSRVQPVTICSQDIISTDNPSRNLAHSQRSQDQRPGQRRVVDPRPAHVGRRDSGHDGAMSSGSEGFCEPERGFRDSDSSCDYKGNPSRSNSLEEVDSLHNYGPKSSIPLLTEASSSSNVNDSKLFMARQPSLDTDVFDESIADLDGAINDAASNISPKNPKDVLQPLEAFAFPPKSQTSVETSAFSSTSQAPSVVNSIDLSLKAAIDETLAKESSNVSDAQNPLSAKPKALKATSNVAKPNNTTSSGAVQNVEAHPPGDEYQIYYYDTKAKVDKKKTDKVDEPNMFAGLRSAENMQDVSSLDFQLF